MRDVCIVTPDLLGPVKNGGIGTHRYWSTRLLKDAGHRVTVFFTGPFEVGDPAYWKKQYLSDGVNFVCLDEFDDGEPKPNGWRRYLNNSGKILRYLEDNYFDIVHFGDWQANGFIPIQAKRTGIALEHTVLTVTTHSSSKWIRECMHIWQANTLDDMVIDFCERYCCENADIIISPSEHMFGWASGNGWKLPENRKVIPSYCKPILYNGPSVKRDTSHLVFFGRLETGKGLDIFVSSVNDILNRKPHLFNKITFLGKLNASQDSLDKISAIRDRYPDVEINLLTDLDSSDAIRYLKNTSGIAVMPSLKDNYPNTVAECIQNEIPFLAAKVGGIPEMVKTANRLFEPTVEGLSAAIEDVDNILESDAEFDYNPEDVKSRWLELHEMVFEDQTVTFSGLPNKYPKVSVCVPYFNHGMYLNELLGSLEKCIYQDYEVIVVNDGSTDPASVKVFEEAEMRYSAIGWKFYSISNSGPSQARNFAAGKSTGDFLLFMDSDNVADPNMIRSFVEGMNASGADCLTCHFSVFTGEILTEEFNNEPLCYYKPVGACLEAGILENVFGDTNFIIKRDVYERLGGFPDNIASANEDHIFLAKLCFEGYILDVVPKALFWYRQMENSRLRRSDSYINHKSVMELYSTYLPEGLKFIPDGIAGMYFKNIELQQEQAMLLEHNKALILALNNERHKKRKGPFESYVSGIIKKLRLNYVDIYFRRYMKYPAIKLLTGRSLNKSRREEVEKAAGFTQAL